MCASSSYRHHSPGSPREQGAHEIPYGPHGKHLLLWQVDVVLQPKGLNPVGVPDQAEVREACILELIQHLDDPRTDQQCCSTLHGVSRQP